MNLQVTNKKQRCGNIRTFRLKNKHCNFWKEEVLKIINLGVVLLPAATNITVTEAKAIYNGIGKKNETVHSGHLHYITYLSAHEAKNNCWLFERLFRVKKNSVFHFSISFSFWRYSCFCIVHMRKEMTS